MKVGSSVCCELSARSRDHGDAARTPGSLHLSETPHTDADTPCSTLQQRQQQERVRGRGPAVGATRALHGRVAREVTAKQQGPRGQDVLPAP